MSNLEVMEKGMRCLLENLGVIETEQFISFINRERFDYTEWRKGRFNDMSLEELNRAAAAYGGEHPLRGQAEII